MQVTVAQVEKVLSGDSMFFNLAFALLISNLKNRYKSGDVDIKEALNEINAFLKKYEKIMGPDIEILNHI